MNKQKWLLALAIIAVLGLWASKKFLQKSDASKISMTQTEGTSYWTCPMHPQIHLDHDGECPICHMKLVKIKDSAKAQTTQQKSDGDKRSVLDSSENQLGLIGIQKAKVEKMTLTAKIPASGRVISQTAVAFQIYESDLRYVHPRLVFKGTSSISTDEEITGTLTSVDSIVDPTSRTIRVIGNFDRAPKGLLSETSFSGAIQIELKDRLAIPESSVLHTGTGDLVYLFGDSNQLKPKKVTLGIKTEGFYEVLHGLNENDQINYLLRSHSIIANFV